MFTVCGFQAVPEHADGKSRAGNSHEVAVGVAMPTFDVMVIARSASSQILHVCTAGRERHMPV